MQVVLPEQGIPNVAPASSAKPGGDANNTSPPSGIFAALLAALQQAAVDVAPAAAGAALNEVATNETATEAGDETESDGGALVEEPVEESSADVDVDNAALLAAVGAIYADAAARVNGGDAKVFDAAGGSKPATGETPTPLQSTAVANVTAAKGGGQGAATLADTTSPSANASLTTSSTATTATTSLLVTAATPGQLTPALATRVLTTPGQDSVGQATQANIAAPPEAALPAARIADEGAEAAQPTPAPPTGVSRVASSGNVGQLQAALPIVVATMSATPASKPALQAAGVSAVTKPAPPSTNANDNTIAADPPRLFADDVTIEETTSSKAASDAPLQARAGDSTAVLADRSASVATAASSAHANADAQANAAASGVQARNDAGVNAPTPPQAPEPPPRPTPADLTQFAVKSVRFLAGRGEETMTVRLVPESLGELRLVVRSGEHSLDVQLSAVNASVRDSLEQQLPALREALARDAGDARQVNITINIGADQQSAGSQFARQFAAAPQIGQHLRHDQQQVLHDLPRMPTRQTTHAGQLDVRA